MRFLDKPRKRQAQPRPFASPSQCFLSFSDYPLLRAARHVSVDDDSIERTIPAAESRQRFAPVDISRLTHVAGPGVASPVNSSDLPIVSRLALPRSAQLGYARGARLQRTARPSPCAPFRPSNLSKGEELPGCPGPAAGSPQRRRPVWHHRKGGNGSETFRCRRSPWLGNQKPTRSRDFGNSCCICRNCLSKGPPS